MHLLNTKEKTQNELYLISKLLLQVLASAELKCLMKDVTNAERAFLGGNNPTWRGCIMSCVDAESTALSPLHAGVGERLRWLSCPSLGICALLWAMLMGNTDSVKLLQHT